MYYLCINLLEIAVRDSFLAFIFFTPYLLRFIIPNFFDQLDVQMFPGFLRILADGRLIITAVYAYKYNRYKFCLYVQTTTYICAAIYICSYDIFYVVGLCSADFNWAELVAKTI